MCRFRRERSWHLGTGLEDEVVNKWKQATCDFRGKQVFQRSYKEQLSLWRCCAFSLLPREENENKYEAFGSENHVKFQSTVNMTELIDDSPFARFQFGEDVKVKAKTGLQKHAAFTRIKPHNHTNSAISIFPFKKNYSMRRKKTSHTMSRYVGRLNASATYRHISGSGELSCRCVRFRRFHTSCTSRTWWLPGDPASRPATPRCFGRFGTLDAEGWRRFDLGPVGKIRKTWTKKQKRNVIYRSTS